MTAREKILQRLSDRRRSPAVRPRLPHPLRQNDDLISSFAEALIAAGGQPKLLNDPAELESMLARNFPEAKEIFDTRQAPSPGTEVDRKHSWDLAILEGKLGVAENGAVWVEWNEDYPRSVLTLAENLALILPREALVATMQEAYEALDLSKIAYGLFLAGPSKTADIEQALVIGAHGAVTLKVFLV
ncbi:LUD domain-containing protein [Nitratifractor sp.]|uniref:LutC/YkgG family protein n=1 Tax=Nitratifractor sp. TaxID=2268144 RepID=UPI0025D7DBB2|nr:LUD domain-containing protein [Nitratifractor sp.]